MGVRQPGGEAGRTQRVDQLALMKKRLAAAGAAVLASAAVFVWRRLRHGRSVAPMSAEQLTEMVLRRLNKQATDAVSSARAESKSWRTKYERAQREAEESREKAAELSKLLTKLCASQPSSKLDCFQRWSIPSIRFAFSASSAASSAASARSPSAADHGKIVCAHVS